MTFHSAIDRLRGWSWSAVRRLAWLFTFFLSARKPHPTRVRVLVLSHHEYSDAYIAPLVRALAARDSVDITVTRAIRPSAGRAPLGVFGGLRVVSFARSLLEHYDLLIDAFPHAASWYPRSLPKLHVPHGISSGKYDAGGDFAYGPSRMRGRDGRLLYDAIACCSRLEQEQAVTAWTALAGRVVVTGDARFDALCAAAAARPPRAANAKPVVMVLSTWGKASLLSTHGPRLFDAVETLLGRYRVVVSIHDLHWRHGTERWGAAWHDKARLIPELCARGFEISDNARWETYLAAADVVVSDHTSLCLYAAALGRPVVMAGLPPETVLPTYPIARLAALTSVFDDAASLPAIVDAACNAGPPAAAAAFGERLFDGRGEAVARQLALAESLIAARRSQHAASAEEALLQREQAR